MLLCQFSLSSTVQESIDVKVNSIPCKSKVEIASRETRELGLFCWRMQDERELKRSRIRGEEKWWREEGI